MRILWNQVVAVVDMDNLLLFIGHRYCTGMMNDDLKEVSLKNSGNLLVSNLCNERNTKHF